MLFWLIPATIASVANLCLSCTDQSQRVHVAGLWNDSRRSAIAGVIEQPRQVDLVVEIAGRAGSSELLMVKSLIVHGNKWLVATQE